MNDEIAALTYIKNLAQLSLAPREEVAVLIQNRFRKTLEEASKNCDFYRDKRNPFPLLTKEEVRNNVHTGLISNELLGHPCLVMEKTSGSDGDAVPFAYLRGFHRYARMVFPFLINTDWKWGGKYCIFSTVHCSRDRCSTEDLPAFVRQVKIPTSDDIFGDQDALQRAAAILAENQDAVIHADPFYLCAAAVYCDTTGLRLSFKGISSTYELLTPSIKKYLEKIFQCRVFDSYGCSEFGPIAFACPHRAKHVFEESVFVEIVDKGLFSDPDIGEIVVTAMDNPAMPLIRYRTGDVGKLIRGSCGCKRTAQMIEISGRVSQCVSFSGVLFSERDIAGLMDIPGVLVYQISQSDQDISFDVVLEKGYTDDVRLRKIESEIRMKFETLTPGRISVSFVKHIKPENTGKFKSVKSAFVNSRISNQDHRVLWK